MARWLGQRNQLVERILRRFFLHMLPKGFVRIQYFAFLANGFRAHWLPLSQQLLASERPTPSASSETAATWHCPNCGATMFVVHTTHRRRTLAVLGRRPGQVGYTSGSSPILFNKSRSQEPVARDLFCPVTRKPSGCGGELFVELPGWSFDRASSMTIPGLPPAGRHWALVSLWLLLSLSISQALAQPSRITSPPDASKTKVLIGNRTRKAQPENDQGPLNPFDRISGITLILKPSPDQAGDLEKLLHQQRDPSSPNYRAWLTPEQYAGRFGLSSDDLGQVISWLQSESFSIDYVARGRSWIMFSGTAGQVLKAFHTEVHRYNVGGDLHYANAQDPSIPAALDPVVLLIRGLDDFRTEPRRITSVPVADYSSGGFHALVPGDLATIYDVQPLYQRGITGSGQKVAVVGQTDIELSDIEHFRSQDGLPMNDPQLVLVTGSPNPGTSANDLVESDLDLEYAGGIAPNATILFVYSTNVWTSIEFAIDEDLAPVISSSYGYCEPQISSTPASAAAYLESLAQEANSMGITWVASSGDTGAADCDFTSEQVATQGLAVDLPASVPEVTGVGGTEFAEGSGNYWSSTNNSNGSSSLSYIPEMAWNDTAAMGVLVATGGGASIFFARPEWQSGAGVPADNARHVPDIAFAAAVAHDPYQIYTGGAPLYVGGTSAPTPVFSGMLALLNQYLVSSGAQSQPGLGNINPALYRLAQTTPGIFHDVTVGSNIVPCQSGSPECTSGQFGYEAGVGYDQATGLGSLDVYNAVIAWNGSQPIATTTSLTDTVSTLSAGGSTVLTATVKAASGTTSPAGAVTFAVGQQILGAVSLSGSGGVATAVLQVNASQLASGANTITASYAGSALFSASSANLLIVVNVMVAVPPSPLAFYSLPPCRVADTRASSGFSGAFGAPSLLGGATRNFPIPSSNCGVPSTAQAYSLNITVIPNGTPLGYLSAWGAGSPQPTVATLNDLQGQTLGNAAIVPAGTGGAISLYVTNNTDVVMDINGYFAPTDAPSQEFYPMTPCRVADTRANSGFTSPFGAPSLVGGATRVFPVQSTCGIPTAAEAYSLRMTVVPPGPLGYLTAYPDGQTLPVAATLNDGGGEVLGNQAIVPAGTNGAIDVFASANTDLIIDINGYFAPPGPGGLNFYPLVPCRVADTRVTSGFPGSFGAPSLVGGASRDFPMPTSPCGIPSSAQAYSLNLTAVGPTAQLYLTAWPTGQTLPVAATLNASGSTTIGGGAIVPAGTNGSISVYASHPTDLVIDVNGYFAP